MSVFTFSIILFSDLGFSAKKERDKIYRTKVRGSLERGARGMCHFCHYVNPSLCAFVCRKFIVIDLFIEKTQYTVI